jgi:hypothetical protein
MPTLSARDTLLRWHALVTLHGSESAALSALIVKSEEFDRLIGEVRRSEF